ncbi:MAG: V-type ATP synthase subunit K [Phycisphaerae bacterium]|jgi:V/A-type H+-transporting ATPase subunit K
MEMMGIGNMLAVLGAAAAVFLSGSGSSIGVGNAGRASAGVLTEKPERYGLNFMLVVLPGTQGIYGLVGAMLVMNFMGFFSADFKVTLSTWQGLTVLAGCLPVGIAGLISAIHQGNVCAAGIVMAAKRPEMAFKAGAVYAAMVELYALFGLLTTIFILKFGVDWEAVKVVTAAVTGQ